VFAWCPIPGPDATKTRMLAFCAFCKKRVNKAWFWPKVFVFTLSVSVNKELIKAGNAMGDFLSD
jgi:hypothetical protein